MRILNFLIAGTVELSARWKCWTLLAETDYKSDQKFRKFTTVFWTQCSLEWTTDTVRNFESLLPHSEPSARWNHSAFWTLCWLEPTTNTFRKLASSLPYSTLLAETDKSSLKAHFELSARCKWQQIRSEISQVHYCILNSVLAGMNYGYDQKFRKFTSTFRTLRWLEPFRILNSLLARTNYKYDQKVGKFTFLFYSARRNWQVGTGSSNAHSELSDRWNRWTLFVGTDYNFASSTSVFWTLSSLEATKIPIINFTSSPDHVVRNAELCSTEPITILQVPLPYSERSARWKRLKFPS